MSEQCSLQKRSPQLLGEFYPVGRNCLLIYSKTHPAAQVPIKGWWLGKDIVKCSRVGGSNPTRVRCLWFRFFLHRTRESTTVLDAYIKPKINIHYPQCKFKIYYIEKWSVFKCGNKIPNGRKPMESCRGTENLIQMQGSGLRWDSNRSPQRWKGGEKTQTIW